MACSTAESLTARNWPGPIGWSCRRRTPRRPLTATRRGSVSRYLNDMAFMPNPPGKYALGAVPFTAEMHQQLEQLGGIYNATDPDLSAFAANGGKLIIYHSWADQAIPPFASINYYRAVVGQAGGLPAAQVVQPALHDSRSLPLPVRTARRRRSRDDRAVHAAARRLGRARRSPRRRSPCPSPRRPPGRMWPLSASILSTPCSRRRATTGSTATIAIPWRDKRL